MLPLKDELYCITDALNKAGLDYAICGGIALAIHGHPRATNDIDLLIPIAILDDVRAVLAAIDYDLESGSIPFDIGRPTER